MSKRVPQPNAHGIDPSELARLLTDHPNFAALGAIGPDLFFFLPDFRDRNGVQLSSVLVGVLDFLDQLYQVLDPFIAKYNRFLGPLEENLEEEISRLTGGLSEAVGNVLGELQDILIGQVEKLAVQQWDFFSFFSLGFNQGFDEQAFLWSDMLHYRKTGQFGQSLWDRIATGEDEGPKAYALGYLTHIATDVTGHAMVNAIAGGPFRLHWQRHHLVENHLDSLWCLNDPLRLGSPTQYGQLTESALYYDIAFGRDNAPIRRPAYPTGNTLRERYFRRRVLDIKSELPESVAQLLIEAMEQTFYIDSAVHPNILRGNDGKPNIDLIRKTYDLLFRFLKITTTDGFGHERPQPPPVFPNLDFPVWSDPAEGSAPGDDDGDSSSWDDFLDFFLSIIKAIVYVVQVAMWLGSLPWAVLADIVAYPLRLGIYYALELPLWHLFKSVRSALVMTGYLAPMDDEISSGLTRVGLPDSAAFEQVKALLDDVYGGTVAAEKEGETTTWRDPAYPHLNDENNFRAPWEYPKSAPEVARSVPPSRFNFITASPHQKGADVWALFDLVIGDPDLRDAFEDASTPNDSNAAGLGVTPKKHLGDSVSFSQYLCWLATRDRDPAAQGPTLVDWNLDADRGYGYHCWDWNRDHNRSEEDPEHNRYAPPCHPPSQTEGLDFNSQKPLAVSLHFAKAEDPGCGGDDESSAMLKNPGGD
jgi:hypothetical protein